MGLTEEELPDIVGRWRRSNPAIVQLWYDVEAAAIEAVRSGASRTVRYVTFARECDPTTGQDFLTVLLPCGRKLYYTRPHFGVNRFGKEALCYADKPMLSADGLLATYTDWRNVAEWPQVPGAPSPVKLAAKQGDPDEKSGVVGAFCRVYDVPAAMDAFLPGVYEPVDTMEGRYSFTGGSTTGGAVLYDDGKFLYSHHATDPAGGLLVNAFDLVRLHRFGDRDDTAEPNTPANRLPSYGAMCELAVADNAVGGLLLQERWAAATASFRDVIQRSAEGGTAASAAANSEHSGGFPQGGFIPPEDVKSEGSPSGLTHGDDNGAWRRLLKVSAKSGLPQGTIDNVWIILEHDPMLRGKFALNEFAGRGEVLGALPWSKRIGRRLWEDNDNQGLYWYLEKAYQLTGNSKIDGALSLHSAKHSFNEVKNYLGGLVWDGVPRLDTLFIDYLGAADSPYARAVTRKAFTAAVARAMVPGTKFDTMTILSGPQGIGKSTLLQKLSRGWFNDSIRTFEGKEASELLQGVWLVEISELDAFRRTDVSRIKQFLSLRVDRFRAAYGRHVKEMPRCCVFFGTTNSGEYLQDKTGNRRFWPVDAGVAAATKSIRRDLDAEIDQLWAEAVFYWRQQEEHREVSAREGLIRDFLEQPVPRDWSRWDINRRRMFWGGGVVGEMELVPRDRVCALEVWCELFEGAKKDMRNTDTLEINAIIASLPGWRKTVKPLRYGYCGPQREFVQGLQT